MKIDWKKIAPYLVALVVFVGFAVLYCSPILEGKVLHAGDTLNWQGAAQESLEYRQETGEITWWTNSMFGGMPTFQIAGRLPSGVLRSKMETITRIGFNGDKAVIGIIFSYFCSFFIMFLCFGVNPWLSIIGSLALGMSTYFFLIIPAGHITKAVALGLLAPIIGGFYVTMQRKYWIGIPLILLYSYTAITLHPQMTYYI